MPHGSTRVSHCCGGSQPRGKKVRARLFLETAAAASRQLTKRHVGPVSSPFNPDTPLGVNCQPLGAWQEVCWRRFAGRGPRHSSSAARASWRRVPERPGRGALQVAGQKSVEGREQSKRKDQKPGCAEKEKRWMWEG